MADEVDTVKMLEQYREMVNGLLFEKTALQILLQEAREKLELYEATVAALQNPPPYPG